MQINYFAAARAAAGTSTEEIEASQVVAGPDEELTLGALTAFLAERHTGRTPSGMSFAKVLEQCSFLIDGVASQADATVPSGARVDVLPPFAGG